MKSSAMPEGEELENFARTKATLAIHLSIRNLREIERVLTPIMAPIVLSWWRIVLAGRSGVYPRHARRYPSQGA